MIFSWCWRLRRGDGKAADDETTNAEDLVTRRLIFSRIKKKDNKRYK